MRRKNNTDVLLESLDLAGKRVIDVGCGDGGLTRLMARQGAEVVGVECGARQLAKARAAEAVPGADVVEGVAQALPAADGSADIVVFFNSLHHVPVAAMDQALAEAARVLKPGGLLYVSEPVAEGRFFELCRPVDDETEVRAAAHRALKKAAGFEELREETCLHTLRLSGFEAFRDRIVSADEERSRSFDALEGELRQAFDRLATPAPDGGFTFDQPSRMNLLRRL